MESSQDARASADGGHARLPAASEGSRTREVLKYVLAWHGSLGALRLNVSRCLISLFDRNYQHVVAEATQSVSLNPDAQEDVQQLRLSGTAIPRGTKCPNELVIESPPAIRHENVLDQAFTSLAPVLVVGDLAEDDRFSDAFLRQNWPQARFYAGVPIRSKKGVRIGVYYVYDDLPRSALDFSDADQDFLRNMANIVWRHLESRAAIENITRGERMVRGLGSFVEGQATISSFTDQFKDAPGQEEGGLNQKQQGLQRDRHAIADLSPAEEKERFFDTRSADRRSALLETKSATTIPRTESPSNIEAQAHTIATTAFLPRPASVTMPDPHVLQLRQAFSRAANIIRESVEVEGALFLDASVGSFGGLVEDRGSRDSTDSNGWRSTTSSSNDDLQKDAPLPPTGEAVNYCDVFGYSTSGASSIDGAASFSKHTLVPERLLKALLRQYPAGKIFNFDSGGSLLSGTSDSDDAKPDSPPRQKPMTVPDARGKRRSNRPFSSLEGQAQALTTLFPGARSVVVIPLWDQIKERWFAGGFIWTSSDRIFTTEGELSYLRAYATTIMGEVHRLNALNSDQVKGDFLSSLSHELRSPLHGVIAAVDLLHGTTLDVFQGDALHIVETSGRTLLDTLDHLLDHSKVNTFMSSAKLTRRERRGSPPGSDHGQHLAGLGMISLTTETSVDVLVEEVVELSVAQLKEKEVGIHDDNRALGRLDSTAAAEAFGHDSKFPNQSRPGLVVYLDMDPFVQSWEFRTQPGALRRVVMNIFGNALKFTQAGFVWISLRQTVIPTRDRGQKSKVVITISDSGKGISEDFLRNDLFKPFMQEDQLAPGTGLGMSLVHSISKTLGGSLAITSQLGRGTTARITLPLLRSATSSKRDAYLTEQFGELRGLRICLRGFDRSYNRVVDKMPDQSSQVSELAVMEMLCRDWLGMLVIPFSAVPEDTPDVFLYSESAFNLLDDSFEPAMPSVIVCQSALTAHALTHSSRKSPLTEFISQPVGPRRLARSLLLGLYRWMEKAPAVASGSREHVSESGPSDAKLPIRGKTNEDRIQARESLDKLRTSLDKSEDGAVISSALSDAGSVGKTASESMSLQSMGESEAEMLPFRPGQTSTSDATGSAQSKGYKYLLVDDNDINLKILASFMKRLGCEYDTAVNGLEALQMYTSNPGLYPFILMDISMPLMDGLESTRKIRELERAEKIKAAMVIALTGLASANIQREAIASGMDMFLTKPVNLKSLQRILGGYKKPSTSQS
ncbi:hypothetical protein Daus18300_004989 [Diaporthe australafricana]|uniref:histidine kinase n=1 Tax=Diaporthe australafricana TaxID=127596 RepID=A0ABR3X5F0_9PEZI